MTVVLPHRLTLNIIIAPGPEMDRLLGFALDVLTGLPEFSPDHWATLRSLQSAKRIGDNERPGLPDAAMVAADPAGFADGFSIEGTTVGLTVQNLAPLQGKNPRRTYGAKQGWRLFDINTSFDGGDVAAFRRTVAAHQTILAEAQARFDVLHADLRRDSATYLGPNAPHADPDLMIYCARTDEISRDYADPDAYWAVWDRVDYFGAGRAIVSRALDVADDTAFKARTMADGFALGRAARPGLTSYFAPDPSPAEQALIAAQDRFVTQIGYDADAQSLEFTAMVPQGAHLTPADVYEMLTYLENGTADGKPVETIIVTFPDRAMAQSQARLLHDIGALVQYFSDAGTWVTLDA